MLIYRVLLLNFSPWRLEFQVCPWHFVIIIVFWSSLVTSNQARAIFIQACTFKRKISFSQTWAPLLKWLLVENLLKKRFFFKATTVIVIFSEVVSTFPPFFLIFSNDICILLSRVSFFFFFWTQNNSKKRFFCCIEHKKMKVLLPLSLLKVKEHFFLLFFTLRPYFYAFTARLYFFSF